ICGWLAALKSARVPVSIGQLLLVFGVLVSLHFGWFVHYFGVGWPRLGTNGGGGRSDPREWLLLAWTAACCGWGTYSLRGAQHEGANQRLLIWSLGWIPLIGCGLLYSVGRWQNYYALACWPGCVIALGVVFGEREGFAGGRWVRLVSGGLGILGLGLGLHLARSRAPQVDFETQRAVVEASQLLATASGSISGSVWERDRMGGLYFARRENAEASENAKDRVAVILEECGEASEGFVFAEHGLSVAGRAMRVASYHPRLRDSRL